MSPKQKFRAFIEDAGGGGAYVDHPQASAFFMRLSYTHQKLPALRGLRKRIWKM